MNIAKPLAVLLLIVPAFANAEPDLINQAKGCIQIKSKLTRLQCFDTVFGTQVSLNQAGSAIGEKVRPEQWLKAYSNESKRHDEVGFLLNQNTDSTSIWSSVSAIGSVPPRPILMFSCTDNISRVELFFPKPLQDNAVTVNLEDSTAVPRSWLTDDTGYVLRTGRGLPAIEFMRVVARNKRLLLRSTNSEVDGLQFNLAGLHDTYKVLRKACHW